MEPKAPLRATRPVLLLGLLTASFFVHAGGYVNGTQVLTQATSVQTGTVSTAVTFNNATLTDQNTIGETNNNLIKTPSTADPVSTVTGNNYHDETDFVIKGRAGLNYAFTRTYNSAPSTTQTDIGLGYGWVHSYAMRLKSNDYGNCPNCTSAQAPENGDTKTSSITYTDERGGDHNYLVNETTLAVTPPQGEFDSLVLNSPASGQHTLTFRNGTKYLFETPTGTLATTPGVVARLKQILDPWGNQLNFSYNAAGKLATVTDNLAIPGRSGLVFSYDAGNHLQSIADWSGRTWTYVVNGSGNLVAYTNPLSQSLTYTYSGAHNLYQIQKPLRGVQTAFSYYQNGRTFNYVNTLGDAETLDYDLYRKSTRVTDPRGGIREYEYDAAGRMTKLTEPDGAILMFQNQADGLRYSKTNGLGYFTQYSYKTDKSFNSASDTYGNVTREQDALNQTVDTTYGPYDQIATVKDKRGTVRTVSFHATTDATCKLAGKPDTVTLSQLTPATGSAVANVKLASYCWNNDGTLKSQTDYLSPTDTAKTRVTTPTYDTAAHLNVQSLTVTGWDGATVTQSYTYDSLGRQKSQTLNRRTSPSNTALVAITTSVDYDALDRPIHVTDALGNMRETIYDANGQISQVIGHYVGGTNRTLSTQTYDAADRLTQDIDVLGNAITYSYDAAGNVIAVKDREDHTTRYEYDKMNRRTAVVDANGYRTVTAYDLAGHPISITNGNGETVATSYDAIGRPTQVTDPLGYVTTSSYDANGNPTCVIDANANASLQPKNSNGCSVFTTYDELNRPIQVKDPLNNLTQTAYDLSGNVLAITDAGSKVTRYAYDGLGRLSVMTDPLTKTTVYVRDEAGNAWQVTNRLNQLTQVSFDILNRPTLINYLTDGKTETFGYDAYGNKQSVANATVAYTFGFDAKNRLTSKLDGRTGKTLIFTYDNADNILTKTDYQNDLTRFTYDSANRRSAMQNSAYLGASYQHDGAGRVISRILSDGAQTQYAYNGNGQLTQIKTLTANGTVLDTVNFTRDRVGNILTQADSGGTTSYSYDALYRLLTATAPSSTEAFTYDAVGNRSTHTLGAVTRVYEYWPNSNRIKAVHTGTLIGPVEKSFAFDDEGRLTSQSGATPKTFAWDQKNRATSINGVVYSYDPMDYRIGQTGGLLGNRDYYLEAEHLEAEYSGSILQAKYFRGLSTDELVAGYSYDSTGNWSPAIYHHDALMSVTGISAHDGAPIQTASYSAFGDRTISSTGTSTNRLTYTGREQDLDSGLMYYRARYYDPSIGRFVSEDPLQFRGSGVNWYAYVDNNPVNGNDPMGLCPNCITAAGGAIIGGIAGGVTGFVKSGGDIKTALIGAGAGATFGALAGFTFGASTVVSGTALAVRGAATGFASGAGGNAAGQFLGNNGQVNISESLVYGIVSTVPGGIQGGLQAAAISSGLQASTANTLGSLSLVAKYKVAATATAEGVKNMVPEINVDLSSLYNQVQDFQNSIIGNTTAASGGFLIYPNKPNTNAIETVYRK